MRGRAIARPSCVYYLSTGGDIVDNDGIVDNNGEFVNFSFLFLEFSLENRCSGVDLDFTADFLTLFLTGKIGQKMDIWT